MYIYIELWDAKQTWLALPQIERQKFMAKVNEFLESLKQEGLELDGCCLNEGSTAPRCNYRYVAIWKAKEKALIKRVADGTAALGWYEYFDQVNAGGNDIGPEGLIGEIMGL